MSPFDPRTPSSRRRPWVLALAAAGVGLLAACKADPNASAAAAGPAPVHAPAAADAEPEATSTPTAGAEATLAQTVTDRPEAEPAVEPPGVGDAGSAPPQQAIDEGPRTVLILGDSFAATGVGALLEKSLDAHPSIRCHRKGKSASGLARPDFFDWTAEGKRQIQARDPDLVVVILGGNDGQDLTPHRGRKRVPWQHADWPMEYRARMDEFLSTLGAPARKVLWLGLPTMGLRSLEKKLELIREIQRDAVLALGEGGIYLDTAPYVTDDSGGMLQAARVGERGKVREIRAEDRIHFTMAGSEYFADRLYPEVLDVLGLEDPAPESVP